MSIIIPIDDRYIPSLHRAVDAVSREKRYFSATQAAPLDSFIEWLQAARKMKSPAYIAIANRSVIGWSIIVRDDYSHLCHAGTLFIGVLPEWRRKGLGQRLLRKVLNKAWETGLTRVALEVYADNRPAIELYLAHGFETEGFLRCAHLVNGQYRDVMTMAVLVTQQEQAAAAVEAQ